ncbi:Cyclin-B2 [Seminavis robusta]|uniref:Cyclin-B2 n=1 Tax=Seminavis robusta TaxID=568900 RepID=A0A9N8EJ84_9STRA|nr:Cyclin-B2 [Seminavis robusta]|eukprot:Sro1228_g254370.1 Cyclin-B2 (333) ;mRNA; f:3351-4578
MVDLVERLDVLLAQEEGTYTTVDYLTPDHQRKLLLTCGDDYDSLVESSSAYASSSCSSSNSGINEFWREKIVEWSYQVIDHFDYSREVVSVSIHYLDRFLAARHVNKKSFQLAAMTSLFLAVKLYEPGRISMSSMIELSRGYFTVSQLANMELELLRVLSWQVHPPTAYCFSKHILFLMPYTSISMDSRHDILELTRFLAELSVIDYFFVARKGSSVALAALLNSMDEIPAVSKEAKEAFYNELQRIKGIDAESPEVLDCRERLRLLYAQGGYSRPESGAGTRNDAVISPVCVSYSFTTPYQGNPAAEQTQLTEPKSTATAPTAEGSSTTLL